LGQRVDFVSRAVCRDAALSAFSRKLTLHGVLATDFSAGLGAAGASGDGGWVRAACGVVGHWDWAPPGHSWEEIIPIEKMRGKDDLRS
jgi:hypothetical protein